MPPPCAPLLRRSLSPLAISRVSSGARGTIITHPDPVMCCSAFDVCPCVPLPALHVQHTVVTGMVRQEWYDTPALRLRPQNRNQPIQSTLMNTEKCNMQSQAPTKPSPTPLTATLIHCSYPCLPDAGPSCSEFPSNAQPCAIQPSGEVGDRVRDQSQKCANGISTPEARQETSPGVPRRARQSCSGEAHVTGTAELGDTPNKRSRTPACSTRPSQPRNGLTGRKGAG